MINIDTRRLTIRNFIMDDYNDLKEIIINKESTEYAVYDHEFPTSDEEIRKIHERFIKNEHFLAVSLKLENKVIGYICFNGEDNMELDLGFCFHSQYKNSGYATEGCRAVMDYVFNNMQIKQISAGTANLNLPAVRVLQKLGFEKISEETLAFRKDQEGNPLVFIGSNYILEKNHWIKKA